MERMLVWSFDHHALLFVAAIIAGVAVLAAVGRRKPLPQCRSERRQRHRPANLQPRHFVWKRGKAPAG